MQYQEVLEDVLLAPDWESINPQLRAEIEAIAELSERGGGGLRSSQVIAVAVHDWRMRNPGLPTHKEKANV